MPDEITIKPKSESATSSTGQENQNTCSVRTQLVNLCALGLGFSFFLPWAHVLFISPSGFDLQKDGGGQLLLWLIPIMCVVTIVLGFAKTGQQIVARLTGMLPFLVGIYWYYQLKDDFFHVLAYGAYLSLFFGLLLLILPKKSK
jgi:hypothetical protein